MVSFLQNYEMFSDAVEEDKVEQFLKMAWWGRVVCRRPAPHLPREARWLPLCPTGGARPLSQCHDECQIQPTNQKTHTHTHTCSHPAGLLPNHCWNYCVCFIRQLLCSPCFFRHCFPLWSFLVKIRVQILSNHFRFLKGTFMKLSCSNWTNRNVQKGQTPPSLALHADKSKCLNICIWNSIWTQACLVRCVRVTNQSGLWDQWSCLI